MKKMTLLFFAAFLMCFSLGAQDNEYEQMAVAMQIHNTETLMDLGLSREQAEELMALRYELQERLRESTLEANVIRAQIARMINSPEADQNEVNRLLEEHSRLRLMREKDQLGYYYQFRAKIGEKQWQALVRMVRNQNRNSLQQEKGTAAQTRPQSGSTQGGSTQSSGRSSSGGGSGN
jgi:hypothetical protein